MSEKRFSTLPKRIAVAVVAIPLIVWLAMAGGYFFCAFVALISSLSLYEFYQLAEKKGAYPMKALGLIAGVFVNGVFIYERAQVELFQFFADRGIRLSMFSEHQFLLVLMLCFVLLVLGIELFRTKGSAIVNAATTVLGVTTVSLLFGTLIALRELFPYGFPVHRFFAVAYATEDQMALINRWGGLTVVAVLATIWICDTAAYFGGIVFGRRKMFERVSPGKTWEGAAFGFVFAILSMAAAHTLVLSYLSIPQSLVIGGIVGVFGQLGDLVESRLKRDAGVKDSSSLIPGHGGVYDRFDSLVFVAPIVYLYVDFIVLS